MFTEDPFSLVQIIGYIALIIAIASYQMMSQKAMFAGRSVGDVLWLIHYILLDGMTAAFALFVGIVRTYLVVFWKPELKNYVIPISILAVFVFCYSLPEAGWIKYMPFGASVIHSVSQYFHDDFMKCRCIMILGPITWFIYALFIGSYGGVAVSVFIFTSHVVGISRYIIKKRKGLIENG